MAAYVHTLDYLLCLPHWSSLQAEWAPEQQALLQTHPLGVYSVPPKFLPCNIRTCIQMLTIIQIQTELLPFIWIITLINPRDIQNEDVSEIGLLVIALKVRASNLFVSGVKSFGACIDGLWPQKWNSWHGSTYCWTEVPFCQYSGQNILNWCAAGWESKIKAKTRTWKELKGEPLKSEDPKVSQRCCLQSPLHVLPFLSVPGPNVTGMTGMGGGGGGREQPKHSNILHWRNDNRNELKWQQTWSANKRGWAWIAKLVQGYSRNKMSTCL